MKKILFVMLTSLFVLGFVSQSRAEDSANTYDLKNRSFQVFVAMYNNGADVIPRDTPVVLDSGANLTSGQAGNLGAFIKQTAATDSIFTAGVSDEAINPGTMGRVCIRGPHKVVAIAAGGGFITSGQILSTSTTYGKAGFYNTTADGTIGGRLGYTLTATATSDTGDATGTLWAWINPEQHK